MKPQIKIKNESAFIKEKVEKIKKEVGKVIVGQEEMVENIIVSIMCDSNALLEGYPGLAKTMAVKTVADIIDLKFSRIQNTPDLMPSDIIGSEILTENREFKFVKGPLFANIILADEINRTPPKTQSALLEAMQEKSVTAAGNTYKLQEPFYVLATQNPIEQEGTYPLPEAQLDRFMLQVDVGYPDEEQELRIAAATTVERVDTPAVVLGRTEILDLQRLTLAVPISEYVLKYAVRLVRATRPGQGGGLALVDEHVAYGAGPRAVQHLVLAAKAYCLLDGRYCVTCEDLRILAEPVLKHRLLINFHGQSSGIGAGAILAAVLEHHQDDFG